jgi:alanine dehydrogenase
MKIGCPKEIKDHEYRVGLTPNAVHSYVKAGHTVYIEEGAGGGSSITDDEYEAAAANVHILTAEEATAAPACISFSL